MSISTPDTIAPIAGAPIGKLHSVQLLRALAAMLVVMFHGQLAFATHVSQPSFAAQTYLFGFGAVGVHIFFVISGFIMVYSSRFANGFDARAFLRRRFLRIYPIYWICAAIYLLVHWLIGQPYELGFADAAGALLLLPGHAAGIIGPAWTLAFEMFFYMCFGMAMIAGLTRGLLMLSAAFLVLIVAGRLFPMESPAWALATSALLSEFLCGAAIGWLLTKEKLPRRGGITMIFLACALFVAGIAWGYQRLPSVVMWGVPSVLLIAGTVMTEMARPARSFVRQLGYFGDSSYALYLVHILMVTLALKLAVSWPPLERIDPMIAALPIALVSLALGEVLHHRIERPLLRRLNPRRALIPTKARYSATPPTVDRR